MDFISMVGLWHEARIHNNRNVYKHPEISANQRFSHELGDDINEWTKLGAKLFVKLTHGRVI